MYKLNQIALITVCSAFGLLAADMPAEHDQPFVMKASQGGQAEVQLGQLAADKATNPKVKDFGKRMQQDHSKAGDELSSIAQKKNLKTSTDLTAKDKALMNRLNGLSGDAFDKAYMSAMVKDHQTDIQEFQKEADTGKDEDVKAFASKTLPTLQDHLKMAKEAAAAVGAAAQ